MATSPNKPRYNTDFYFKDWPQDQVVYSDTTCRPPMRPRGPKTAALACSIWRQTITECRAANNECVRFNRALFPGFYLDWTERDWRIGPSLGSKIIYNKIKRRTDQ